MKLKQYDIEKVIILIREALSKDDEFDFDIASTLNKDNFQIIISGAKKKEIPVEQKKYEEYRKLHELPPFNFRVIYDGELYKIKGIAERGDKVILYKDGSDKTYFIAFDYIKQLYNHQDDELEDVE